MNTPIFTDDLLCKELSPQPFSNLHYRTALKRLGYTLLEFDTEIRYFIIPPSEAKRLGLPIYIYYDLDTLVDKGYLSPDSVKAFARMLKQAQSGRNFIRGNIMLGRGKGVYIWFECNMFSFINNPCILIAVKNIHKDYEKNSGCAGKCSIIKYCSAVLCKFIS